MADGHSVVDEKHLARTGPLRGAVIQTAVAASIICAIGIVFGLLIDWFPSQAAEEAEDIDRLYDILVIASVPIFVLTQTIVLFSVWKFRQRPGEENLDGPPIHGNTRIEVIWTAIPAIILIALCTYAYIVLTDIEEKDSDRMFVNVTGQQFAWTFEYPVDGKQVKSDQLYVPQGKQVEFKVRSKDVIHDFWVPNFRLKVDAVPGSTTEYRVTPSRLGTYPVVCAELCGLGHSTMRQTVHVIEQNRFDTWLTAQAERAQEQAAAPS